MQKPSLGRVVLYHNPMSNEINVGHIVGIADDEHVTIALHTCKGAPYASENVLHGEGPGRWSWPPFVAPGTKRATEPAGPNG